MKAVSEEIQDLSIKSLESTLNKLSNASNTMSAKGANTNIVKKRRNAVQIGLTSLKDTWNKEGFFYNEESILITKDVLQGILPSIKKQIEKAKEGSSQKTLNERRLLAIKLALESLEDRLRGNETPIREHPTN
ncbi:hypothetical protein [Guptibacillus spartinae]|uniref:hypothetical protein n=1 Tax=Guptibacillus spartinae TaxID=3025679 RepID=UPI002361EC3D|nr:hypothetical protein [Pseudalkalibacillus spartinae]